MNLFHSTLLASFTCASLSAEPDYSACSCNQLLGDEPAFHLIATDSLSREKQQMKKLGIPDTSNEEPRTFEWGAGTKVLIVGGHFSHDFDRWFDEEDTKTLKKDPPVSIHYTDRLQDLPANLDHIDVLYLSHNQGDNMTAEVRAAIEKFVDNGGGLLVIHAANWINWKDWDRYYRDFIGGYSRGHDKYGEFTVKVTNREHPITKDFPESFQVMDELYYHNVSDEGAEINILAEATSSMGKNKGKTFPTMWTVKHPKAKIFCLTLGHAGPAHESNEYQTLLRRGLKWVTPKKP